MRLVPVLPRSIAGLPPHPQFPLAQPQLDAREREGDMGSRCPHPRQPQRDGPRLPRESPAARQYPDTQPRQSFFYCLKESRRHPWPRGHRMYRSGQAVGGGGGVRAPQGLCTAQQPAGSGRRFGHPKSLLCPLAQSQVGGHAPVPLPLRGRTGTHCHCKVRAASPSGCRCSPALPTPMSVSVSGWRSRCWPCLRRCCAERRARGAPGGAEGSPAGAGGSRRSARSRRRCVGRAGGRGAGTGRRGA